MDATKGILVILIVLGHNQVLMGQLPGLRWFLYNWHVYSFFLLSALTPVSSTKVAFIADRLVRYGVPFAIFSTVAWLVTGGWATPTEKVGDWLMALVIGSADLLDRASGARLYWFLPALLGLILIRWLIALSGSREAPVLLIVSIAGFLFAGFIPAAISVYLPLGLPIALYILGPSVAFSYLYRLVNKGRPTAKAIYATVLLVIFSLCSYATYYTGTSLVLASFQYYDVTDLLSLLLHATIPVTACGVLIANLSLARPPRSLMWVGRNSLIIYLVHQFIYHVLSRVLMPVSTLADDAFGFVLFITTAALSMAFAKAVHTYPMLRRWLTPYSLAEWRQSLGVEHLRSGRLV